MSSSIYKNLLQRQIDYFIDTFQQDSNSMFKSREGKLFHPGEYGMYREECFKKLLQTILDKDYQVSDGFIINSANQVSTQCDVLVNRYNSKPLTDGSYAKFYPVEDIYAIGEIKSNLSKSQFKDALRKLAYNKMMGDSRKILKDDMKLPIANYINIPTFLVCNKLVFDLNEIDFNEIYFGIPVAYWHNCILSLEDGIITYELDLSKLGEKSKAYNITRGYNVDSGRCDWPCSQHIMIWNGLPEIHNCTIHIIVINKEDIYGHIYNFLGSVEQAVSSCIKYKFDFGEYLGIISKSLKTDSRDG